MKRHFLILGSLILVSAAIVAGVGAYLKYDIIKPLNLPDYGDKSVFELPFLLYSDPVLQFMVEHAEELRPTDNPTEPSVPDISTPSTPTTGTDPSDGTDPSSGTEPSSGTIPSSGTEPSSGTIPSSGTEPSATTPPSTTVPSTTPTKPADKPNFDYPGPPVSDAWFRNTLFIGDSRVVGLRDYARSGSAEYFCDVGMTVFNVSDKQLSDKTFSKQTLKSLLSSKKYDKIFINLGLNEAGYPLASFSMRYKQFVAEVRSQQPDAVIVLQGIMSVTRNKAATASYFQPSYLAKMNQTIKSLADGEKTFYVDVNEYFADSEGYLYTSLTNDGYHPTGTGYREWKKWIAYIAGTLGV